MESQLLATSLYKSCKSSLDNLMNIFLSSCFELVVKTLLAFSEVSIASPNPDTPLALTQEVWRFCVNSCSIILVPKQVRSSDVPLF